MKPYCFTKMPAAHETTTVSSEERHIFQKFDCDIDGETVDTGLFNNNEAHNNTNADANSLEKEAYAKGFKKGERDGVASFHERLDPVIQNFREAVLKLDDACKAPLLNAEEAAARFALAIDEKIIYQEVQMNKEIVLNVVKAALSKVVDHKKIKIRLSASDLMFIKEIDPELLDFYDQFESVTFEEDPSIKSGGCIVETGLGDVAARIEKQLEAIRMKFGAEMQKTRLKVN